ncbi:hypothetical protein [Nitrosarchaeum sp.]|uniref:hypothetical protein n=1 Tax=Nitrosarchaeum sp. TaxID=2026886 RepID=UPI00247DFA84|nr:hypothetical protein [Nitrosarchaeum sp.]MCV0411450.1 hypothetical protein [Nitrosarchaeum sp.]
MSYSFENDSLRNEELSRSLDSIVKCYKCLSNENLCWFHSESVKTVLIGETKATIFKLKNNR